MCFDETIRPTANIGFTVILADEYKIPAQQQAPTLAAIKQTI